VRGEGEKGKVMKGFGHNNQFWVYVKVYQQLTPPEPHRFSNWKTQNHNSANLSCIVGAVFVYNVYGLDTEGVWREVCLSSRDSII